MAVDLHTLSEHGYSSIREIKGRGLCGIQRFIFTCGICCNLEEYGYGDRFCFESMLDAELFLRDWDGVTEPVIGEDGCTAIKTILRKSL